ncbi:MAG: TauD/TfdA family dioxygenase [Caulobacterales bacterium]
MTTTKTKSAKPETRPLKPGFGTEILGVDLAAASDEQLSQVVATFHESGAIALRDQKMSPDDLVRFVAAFGEPEGHTLSRFTLPGYPLIYVLSNRVENGEPVGAHYDGLGWHTDYSYTEDPVMCTMLYAVQAPPEGADTLLADGCAAYEALSDDRKEALEKLKLHHSYVHFVRNREYGRMEPSEELKAANPDVIHPLIRTHPADGRKALWPSTGTVTEIIGAENPSDLSLLDELISFMTQEQFIYRHKWQVGDVLVWDNRCTLHTGTMFDDQKYIREMHRLWVRGDRPF